MKTRVIVFIAAIIILIAIGYKMTGNIEKTGEAVKDSPTKVLLKTNVGDIVIELYDNMPITSGNFENLVKQGVYDGVIFHRVIPNFMIQGGDPTGTGMGDPSIPAIEDEFVEGSSNLKYTIAMANRGPNTGSSQFFINLVDNTYLDWDKPPLTSKHPVFGKVVEGMDVVDKIGKVQTGANDKPVQDVVIEKAEII
jgi:peptidylprolyl isomerase